LELKSDQLYQKCRLDDRPSAEAVDKYHLQAEEHLKNLGVAAEYRDLTNPFIRGLASRIHQKTAGPVIIPCLEDWFAGEKLCGLVEEIVNPVLLVR